MIARRVWAITWTTIQQAYNLGKNWSRTRIYTTRAPELKVKCRIQMSCGHNAFFTVMGARYFIYHFGGSEMDEDFNGGTVVYHIYNIDFLNTLFLS